MAQSSRSCHTAGRRPHGTPVRRGGPPEVRGRSRVLWVEPLEDRRLLAITVTTLEDEADGSVLDGDASLRDAIAVAAPGETINFAVAGVIKLIQGELEIRKNLTINGAGDDVLSVVQETANSRVFNIDDGAINVTTTVVISGLWISGGEINGNGGGIRNREQLTLNDSRISGNQAVRGGGIENYGGTLTLNNCNLFGNTAERGGGLYTSDATVAIQGGTIWNNSATSNFVNFGGGGVFNGANGNLTITGTTVEENEALRHGGGIFNSGSVLTVTRCTISGNVADLGDNQLGWGGGIHNRGGGLVTIVDSTIRENRASHGGGVQTDTGTLNLTSSTLSGNTARVGGGGGVHGQYGAMNLMQVTLSGNFSERNGGGLESVGSITNVRHSTVAFNTGNLSRNPAGQGGGVAVAGGTLALDHTIACNNTVAFLNGQVINHVEDDVAGVFSARYSLMRSPGNFLTYHPTNILYATAKLSPLGSFGGPTPTHALEAGSLAIDAGQLLVAGAPAVDQRGNPFMRIADGDNFSGARIDIGAWERHSLVSSNLVVSTLADEQDGDYSAGDLSLREALGLASGSEGFNTVSFAPSLTSGGPAVIRLSLGELQALNAVSIVGPGAKLLTLDAAFSGRARVLRVQEMLGTSPANFEVSGLTLTRAFGESVGGGILVGEQGSTYASYLSVVDCAIVNNSASSGGGIGVLNGFLAVTGTTISGNQGSGIYAGDVTIERSTITNNDGGVIANDVTATFSTIVDNPGSFDPDLRINGSGVLDHVIVGSLELVTEVIARYSFVREQENFNVGTFVDTATNFLGIDPQLGPLADHGGPTRTRAPLPGSPVIDGGNPSASPGLLGVPIFDQRGAPNQRKQDGDGAGGPRVDIGAIELQQPYYDADFDLDGDVDGADFLIWQRGVGTVIGATRAKGNADGDMDVDGADLAVWRSQSAMPPSVSEPLAAPGVVAAPQAPSRQDKLQGKSSRVIDQLSPHLVDAAMACKQSLADAAPRRPFRPRQRTR